MPWHSFQKPADLKPNTVYEFQIELQPVFKTFKKGCRIWLKIASDDALYSTRDISSRYVETPLVGLKTRFIPAMTRNTRLTCACQSFLMLPK
jgi:predicted acyl esterase